MHIVCPECQFAREIPDAKIPPTAEMATCPKCRNRFRFRTVSQSDAAGPESDQGQPPQHASDHRPDRDPPREPGPPHVQPDRTPEPGPPPTEPDTTAPTPSRERDERFVQPETPPQPEVQPRTGRDAEQDEGDIWDRLDAMGGPRDQHGEGGRAFASGDGVRDLPPSWENLEQFGFFKGFGRTVKNATFGAPEFFRRMPLGRGIIMPLGFYMLIIGILSVVQLIWHNVGMGLSTTDMSQYANNPSAMELVKFINTYTPLYYLVLGPAFALVYLYVDTLFSYVFLSLVKANKGGFEGTFRASSYAAAPFLFTIIPVPGVAALVAFLWATVVNIIGFKEVHETGYFRVIMALVLKHVVMVIFLMGVVMALGAMIAGKIAGAPS